MTTLSLIMLLAADAATQDARPAPPAPPPPVYIPRPPAPAPYPYPVPAPPAPPPPPPPPSWSAARGPVIRSGSISNDDYPAAAIRLGEEGMVTVRMTVGVGGRVTGCTIVASSGSSILDSTTCSLLTRRFRFAPARDYRGRPAVGYVTQRVVWRLPEDVVPAPFVPGYVAVSIPFVTGGCGQAASTPELLPIAPDLCAEAFPTAERAGGRGAGGPALAVLTISDSGPRPPPRPDVRGTLRYREEASFEVHGTGAALACRQTVTRSTRNEAPFDLCRYLATEDGPFFAPNLAVPGPRQGRMTLEIHDLPAPIHPDDL